MRRANPKKARQRLNRALSDPDQQIGAAGRRVLEFVAENRELVLASSAAEMAARTGTSDATVVRTVQALGFSGLADLKRTIVESLVAESSPADDMRRTLAELSTSTETALNSVLEAHAEGIAVLSSPECRAQIAAAVQALEGATRVVVFGIGPSAALAGYVVTLLGRSGRRARSLDVTGSMLADQLLDLGPGDAILVLAYGQLYKEVVAVFDQAKTLGLPSVVMTEASDGPLSRLADVTVAVPRGRPGNVALHGATLVGLESLILSLAAAQPERALESLDRLGELRGAVGARQRGGGTPKEP